MGIDPASLPNFGSGPLGIYPWNVDALEVWCATWRQWKFLSAGRSEPRRIGLDWCQVESAVRLAGVPRRRWRAVFEALRVMQDEALMLSEEAQ